MPLFSPGVTNCDGAIASASLFAIAFAASLLSISIFLLIKGKVKEKFKSLIKFRESTAEESPYTDVRHPTSTPGSVETDLTMNVAYGQPTASISMEGR